MKKSAFTLVEILVATLLLGVVMAVALGLFQTSRQVGKKILEPVLTPFHAAVDLIERDLHHLQPLPMELPIFLLEAPEADALLMEWNTLRKQSAEAWQAGRVAYRYTPQSQTLSVVWTPHPDSVAAVSSTNILLQSLPEFRVSALGPEQLERSWKSDSSRPALPSLLRLEAKLGEERLTRDLLLPVAMTATSSLQRVSRL